MNMKLISLVVGVSGLLALAACDSSGGGTGGNGAVGGQNVGGQNIGGQGGGITGFACADLVTTDLSGWPMDQVATDFSSPTGFDAYDALTACVCGAGTPCSLVCNDPAHPSFCAGTAPVAGGMCETCIKQTTGANGCADEFAACEAN